MSFLVQSILKNLNSSEAMDRSPYPTSIISIMFLKLMAMLYAREILNFLKSTLFQVFSLTLNIIQLILRISFIFSAINLQFLTIYYILNRSF